MTQENRGVRIMAPQISDPINKEQRTVRSIYIPSKTLLQGKEYKRTNDFLLNKVSKNG